MNRRRFLAGSAAAFSMLAGAFRARAAQPQADHPFDANVVRRLAQELASKPYKQPDTSLPDEFKDINYDAYRSIRFRPEQAIWRAEKLPFQLQFFHRGWIFKNRALAVLSDPSALNRLLRFSPTEVSKCCTT